MRRPSDVKNESTALPFTECLAKTVIFPDGVKGPGLEVEKHCYNVGLVARKLISCYPKGIQDSLYPAGSEFVAAVHDVGKVSPDFQKKIYLSFKSGNELPAALRDGSPNNEESYGYHGGISQSAIEAIPVAGRVIARIVGKHHGRNIVHNYSANSEFFGGPAWQREREALIEVLKDDLRAEWPLIKNFYNSLVLSGLTTVADWIGSGYPFADLPQGADKDWKALSREAVNSTGFKFPKIKHGLSFCDVFDFQTRPEQQALIECVDGPGLYVLEAPMGSGKTEAALFAGYRMLEQEKAAGLYFALPTRLTSNRIFHRVNGFLDRIIDEPHPKAKLCHGSAWLLENDLGEEGSPGKSWFDHTKRGLLAPFGVGTIDQALLAIMNVKHGFVRAFGLAGKVVILDEVHSYDSYTGTILDELSAMLKEIDCTVIILSATLTRQRKELLLHSRFPQPAQGYPMVSLNSADGRAREIRIIPSATRIVSIKRVADDQIGIEEALMRAERGQQVLWIENTVSDAQSIYKSLAARGFALGLEIGLLHSRFIPTDREKKETLWVNLYGRLVQEERKKTGRVLIGTQVLEQSLDLDADFLITRLAPTDMLLQRMGRLWRHRENDKLRSGDPREEMWILTPSIFTVLNHKDQSLKKMLGKSVYVYAPYILLRTLELWETIDRISLPDAIRELVESTYSERDEAGIWEKAKNELEKEKEKMRRFALLGTSTVTNTQNDINPSTRFGDEETCKVLLARRCHITKSGTSFIFLDNSEVLISASTEGLPSGDIKTKAIKLLENIVPVPKRQAPSSLNEKLRELIGGYIYIGRGEENDFRLGIVSPGGEITDINGNMTSLDFELFYDNRFGYAAQRIKKGEDKHNYGKNNRK